MSFYHNKQTFLAKGSKVTICLHNGNMRPNKNGQITYTVTENINTYCSGTTKAFKNVYSLLNYIVENRLRFNKDKITDYDKSLRKIRAKKHL